MSLSHKSRGSVTVEATLITPIFLAMLLVMTAFVLLPLWKASAYATTCEQVCTQRRISETDGVYGDVRYEQFVAGEGVLLGEWTTDEQGILKTTQYLAQVDIPLIGQSATFSQTVRTYSNAQTAMLYASYRCEE